MRPAGKAAERVPARAERQAGMMVIVERVPARAERQAGMMVIVERTKGLVPHNLHSKSLGDPLDGEVAELLKF